MSQVIRQSLKIRQVILQMLQFRAIVQMQLFRQAIKALKLMKLCLRIKHSNPMLHLIPHNLHRRIQLAIIAVRMYLNLPM